MPEAQEAPSLIWQLSPYLSDDSRKKLMILLGNIDREPDMPKFRTLRTTNRSMTKLLGQPSVEPLLKLAGFRDEDGVLVFPADAPLEQLRSVLVAIAEEPSSASSSAAAEPQPEVEPTSPATSPAASTAAEDQLRALLRGSSPDSPQRDSSPGTPSAAAAVPCTTAAPAEDQLRELLKSGTATPVARPPHPRRQFAVAEGGGSGWNALGVAPETTVGARARA